MSSWPGWRLARAVAGRLRGWLPRRTVRLRLTVVYVILFLASGAGLLTITYLLVDNHSQLPTVIGIGPAAAGPGASNLPSATDPAGSGPPTVSGHPAGSGGASGSAAGQVCVSTGSTAALTQKFGQCVAYFRTQETAQRADYLKTLLIGSCIALAAMTVVAVGLGWLMAGRVLRPLRTITWAARTISASNLHKRLALAGPEDELKELGDTFDGLLARLEGSFEAQRQFVANASHELRTPLARQRTMVEVALADPAPTVAGLRGVCDRVVAAGEQQERLIEALLTLARSQRGLDRWEPVDIRAVTAEALRARHAEAASQRLRISTGSVGDCTGDTGECGGCGAAGRECGGCDAAGRECGGCGAIAIGDARLAERLVANLLDNALRHNQPDGWISVRVGQRSGRAVLAIANSGPLISSGDVARLFEPFQRLAANRASSGGDPSGGRAGRDGLGLGLSIVGAIAAAHGADVHAGALPGGGLEVEVLFPPAPDWVPDQPGHPGPPGLANRD
jgi:signal transduction histidine kinase